MSPSDPHAKNVPKASLAGCLARLARAHTQIGHIERRVRRFCVKPYRIRREDNFDAREIVLKLSNVRHPRIGLSLLIGECLHNLRSSLDNLVWQAAIMDGKTPGDHTGFPIVADAAKWKNAGEKIRPLSTDKRQWIKDKQPCNSSDAHAHPLHILHRLNLLDKHMLMIQCMSANEFMRVWNDLDPPTTITTIHGIGPGVLENGKIVVRANYSGLPVPHENAINVELVPKIVFSEGSGPGAWLEVVETLIAIKRHLNDDIFGDFRNKFGPI